MKLMRVGPLGKEKPAVLDAEGTVRDLSGHLTDIDGAALSDSALASIAALDLSGLPEISASERIGACVGNIGKFICIGLNYSCLLYTSPSPRDRTRSRMPSSA